MDRRTLLFGLLERPAADPERLGREAGAQILDDAWLFAFVRGFNSTLARRTAARLVVAIGVRSGG